MTDILTEAQAKTKTCHETFRQEGGPHPCIGSACMAWRWYERPASLGAWRESQGFGYCGRAGEPRSRKP